MLIRSNLRRLHVKRRSGERPDPRFSALGLCFASRWHRSNDIRVAWIGDGKDADAEVFTAGGSQLDVVAVVMMDASLGQHGVVLNLAFAELRAVAGNDYEFRLALSQRLKGLFHPQAVFAALHDQSESGVDRLQRLLGFLRRNHCYCLFGKV